MIKNFLKKWKVSLQKDKVKHFYAGMIIGCISLISIHIGILGYFIALALGQIAGYGLEVYQSTTKKRHVEANDAFATVAGSTVTITIIMLLCIM